MRHDWIIDVLTDLASYADRNGLLALREKVEETLIIARVEIAADGEQDRTEVCLKFHSARRAH